MTFEPLTSAYGIRLKEVRVHAVSLTLCGDEETVIHDNGIMGTRRRRRS